MLGLIWAWYAYLRCVLAFQMLEKLNRNKLLRRPGAGGGGGISGPCPPNDCLCPPQTKIVPPKRGLCPEEINRLGATGVRIEVQIGVCHRYLRNFRGLTPNFMTYLGWRPYFFFFGDNLFSAEKNVWLTDFSQKISLNFWSTSCSFDTDWDKFLMPPCSSQIYINELLVPPQNLFLPPHSRYPEAGPAAANWQLNASLGTQSFLLRCNAPAINKFIFTKYKQ